MDLEKRRAYDRKYYHQKPELKERKAKQRYKNRMRKTYGMSLCEYESLLTGQNYKCAICGSIESGRKNALKLCIDHSHSTNKIRALLCFHCNSGLGHFKDNSNLLSLASKYLEKHNEPQISQGDQHDLQEVKDGTSRDIVG